MIESARTRPVHWLVLALVLAFAAGLRFRGIDRLLPHRFEPDAFVVYMAEDLRDEPGRVRTQEFAQRYPTLLARTAALVPKAPIPLGLPPEDAERAHLARAGRTFHDVRVLIALLSIALVPLTFLLARRFLSPASALVAASFVATSLLHLFFSDQARPHGAYATLAVGTVILAVTARAKESFLLLLAAGACAGLALGVLQTGLFVLPPIVIAAALGSGGKFARAGRACAAIAVALAVAVPFNDFLPVIDEHGITMSGKGGHAVRLSEINGGGFAITWRSLWGQDPVLAVLGLLGLAWLVAEWLRTRPLAMERRADLLVVLAHAAPYTLVLVVNEHISERYFLPLLPGLACAAAFVLARVFAGLGHVRARVPRLAACALVCVAVAWWPLTDALRYAHIAAAPDTYERTADWLRENVPASDKVVVIASGPLPLLHARDALDHDLADFAGQSQPWFTYQGVLPDAELARGHELFTYPAVRPAEFVGDEAAEFAEARRYLADAKPRWIVVEESRFMRSVGWSRSFVRAARERGEMNFSVRAERDDDAREVPHPYQNAHYLAFRLGEMECWGPRFEVYRWPE